MNKKNNPPQFRNRDITKDSLKEKDLGYSELLPKVKEVRDSLDYIRANLYDELVQKKQEAELNNSTHRVNMIFPMSLWCDLQIFALTTDGQYANTRETGVSVSSTIRKLLRWALDNYQSEEVKEIPLMQTDTIHKRIDILTENISRLQENIKSVESFTENRLSILEDFVEKIHKKSEPIQEPVVEKFKKTLGQSKVVAIDNRVPLTLKKKTEKINSYYFTWENLPVGLEHLLSVEQFCEVEKIKPETLTKNVNRTCKVRGYCYTKTTTRNEKGFVEYFFFKLS
jgi:hypothetical protein